MSAPFFRAFANHTRISILRRLAQEPLTVMELAQRCDLSSSAASQHLAKLRAAGLICGEKKGRTVSYRLTHRQIGQLAIQITQLMEEFHSAP